MLDRPDGFDGNFQARLLEEHPTIDQLEHGCKFPIGEDREGYHRFCARPVEWKKRGAASGADGPLTRDEIAQFGQELGARAERWRIACELHWLDLAKWHEGGGWK